VIILGTNPSQELGHRNAEIKSRTPHNSNLNKAKSQGGGVEKYVCFHGKTLVRGKTSEVLPLEFTLPHFDERGFQEDMMAFLGTDHSRAECTQTDIGRVFPQVIWHTSGQKMPPRSKSLGGIKIEGLKAFPQDEEKPSQSMVLCSCSALLQGVAVFRCPFGDPPK
jgi:hypothetical protein